MNATRYWDKVIAKGGNMDKRFFQNKLLYVVVLGFLLLSSIANAFGRGHYGRGYYGGYHGGGYYHGGHSSGGYWVNEVIAPIVTVGTFYAIVTALTPSPTVIVQQPVVVPQTVYIPQEVFPQTTSRPMPASVVINIPNSNGSYTPVTLWKSFDGYVGPQGEYYPGRPTVEQLKVLYGK